MNDATGIELMESVILILADVVANGFMLSLLIVGGSFLLLAMLEKLRPVNAATRYALWGVSLALIVVSHAGLTLRHLNTPAGAPPVAQNVAQEIEAPQAQSELLPASTAAVPEESSPDAIQRQEVAFSAGKTDVAKAASTHVQRAATEPVEVEAAAGTGVTVRGAMSWVLTGVLGLIVLGMMVGLIRLAHGMLFVVRLHRRAQPMEGERQRHTWMDDLHRSIVVAESDLVASPVAVGLFGSKVVVPTGLKECVSAQAWEQMLLHETAHLERFDDCSLLFQRFVESLFFYNPIVKWVGNQLSDEREAACDDWVVARTRNPVHYVASIGEVMQARIVARRGSLTPGLADQPGSLLKRMQRVLENGIPVKAMMSKEQVAVLSAIAILLVVLVFATSPFMTWDVELERSDSVDAVQVVDRLPEPPPLAPLAPSPAEPALPQMAPSVGSPALPADPDLRMLPALVDPPEPAALPRAVPAVATGTSEDPFSESSWERILTAASKVSADSEKAGMLRFSVGRFPMTSRTLDVWLKAAKSVSGGAEKAALLKALVRDGRVPNEFMPRVIQVAATIRSDGDKASTISTIMREASDTEANRKALQEAIESVASSGEQARLLAQFAREYRS